MREMRATTAIFLLMLTGGIVGQIVCYRIGKHSADRYWQAHKPFLEMDEGVDCQVSDKQIYCRLAPAGIGKTQALAPIVRFDNPRLDLNLDGVNILLDCSNLKGSDEMSVGMVQLNQCKERIDAWRKREEKMDGPVAAHPLKKWKPEIMTLPTVECPPSDLVTCFAVHPLKLGKRKPALPKICEGDLKFCEHLGFTVDGANGDLISAPGVPTPQVPQP